MTRINLTGVHRVRMKLADGTKREYHYAWRGKGAPRFWSSESDIKVGSADYLAALAACASKGSAAKGKFREVILAFLSSAEFEKLAPRTKSDMRGSINHASNGIDKKFGDAPIAAFNDPRIRTTALKWRDSIGGKVGDDRIRHLQRLVGFGLDRRLLQVHQLREIKSIYRSNRSEIFWLPDEIETFKLGAPKHVWRILAVALETGLRPGDLSLLSREHIHRTPHGHRIVVWTKKRRRLASIPVTPRMAELIAETPERQERLIVNKGGQPYKHENYLGDAVSEWRDILKLRKELRLYDARGTAATRLLDAGAELKEIATHMGWSIKHAAEVIERYVALSPRMTDGLAAKLAEAEKRTNL
ncbi:tyrosine-type recombinase/integrase [Paracoccus sulfuroxidans]|uniref:Phage integrase family protein n=1 Tax=Paracoccus sulfuroxidans TaxID=384678 RepID=A0A562NC08_9RHOB|nr:tyrosine-type recombinase/integrase [Paracoccus sulfuroxidans]TWI29705.1 phage integrase family protein [Paracoccus sulfuroxidans]